MLKMLQFLFISLCFCNVLSNKRDELFANPPTEYEKFLVIRVLPNTTEQLESLHKLYVEQHIHEIDFWKRASGFGQFADIMVKESRKDGLISTLKDAGLQPNVTIADVQKLIIERESPKKSSWMSRVIDSSLFGNFFKRFKDDSADRATYGWGEYHDYSEITRYLDEVAQKHPDIASTYSIGFTVEGRPIKGIKIGRAQSFTKRAVWVDGGIHAREWAAVHTALWFVHQLVANRDDDPQIADFVNNLDIYIIPVINPDGYEYSRNDITPMHRLWRKNRGGIVCKMDRWFRERCCGGVDLNRNFDFHWAETGSSEERCSEVYQGNSAFSEPESRAIRDKVFSPELNGRLDAFITLHTYAQMWIHPYSDARRSYPADVQELREVGRRGVAALQKAFGTQYRFGTGADILYPSSGGSDDWAKGVGKIKYVYLLELRPADEVWDGFLLDTRQLIPTGKETWEGIKVVIQAVRDNTRKEQGQAPVQNVAPPTTAAPTTTRIPWWITSTTPSTTRWTTTPEITTMAPPPTTISVQPFTVTVPRAPPLFVSRFIIPNQEQNRQPVQVGDGFTSRRPKLNRRPTSTQAPESGSIEGSAEISRSSVIRARPFNQQASEEGLVTSRRPAFIRRPFAHRIPSVEQATSVRRPSESEQTVNAAINLARFQRIEQRREPSPNWVNPNNVLRMTPSRITQQRRTQHRIRTNCVDRSPWCQAWIQGNPSVCQISSIYMSKDCARSCGFCRTRSSRLVQLVDN